MSEDFPEQKINLRSQCLGHYRTRIYNIWAKMMRRCYEKELPQYPWYGARGIRVHKDWHNFANFLQDMLPGYSDNLTLDRVDNNQHYCKDNCRWVSMAIQNRNRRSNIVLEYEGATYCMTDLAKKLGFSRSIMFRIVIRGDDPKIKIVSGKKQVVPRKISKPIAPEKRKEYYNQKKKDWYNKQKDKPEFIAKQKMYRNSRYEKNKDVINEKKRAWRKMRKEQGFAPN